MAASKPINWQNTLTVVTVGILVGTELVGMSWAAGWALGGLFDLPPVVRYGIEILSGLVGFIGLFYFLRAALRVEPIRG